MKNVFVFFLRIFLGVMLIYSGFVKMISLPEFIEIVRLFDVLPDFLQLPFAALLPAVEVTLGISLLFGIVIKAGSFLCSILFLLFAVAVIPQLLGNTAHLPDCGCFGGVIESKINSRLLFRDILFFMMSYLIFMQQSFILAVDNHLDKKSMKG